MKKIFALIVVCALMLCMLVACDNEDPTEVPTTAPTEAPTTAPTEAPTAAPTEAPTTAPTEAPTSKPTEAPTTAPTEAPTDAPTEAPTEIDLEEIEAALLTANQYIESNPNFKVNTTTETLYDEGLAESMGDEPMTSTQVAIFTSTAYKSEQSDSDGNFDIYTLIDGVLYNHYGVGEDTYKEKTLFSEEEYDLYLSELRAEYMYDGELEMFESVEVTENEDGSVTYILNGWVAEEGSEEDMFSDMITNMAMSITLDSEGRFASISTAVEMSIDLVIMTFDSTLMNTMTYTYYTEGELEITAPEDADEYEEYIEEEWICDCGAESWEDCVCEYEWSCDCGAESWEDCVCEFEWSCDCGAESWEDCVCE